MLPMSAATLPAPETVPGTLYDLTLTLYDTDGTTVTAWLRDRKATLR